MMESVVWVGIGVAALFTVGVWARRYGDFTTTKGLIAYQLYYQGALFVFSVLFALTLWALYPDNAARFIAVGEIDAQAKSVAWMGIGEERWESLGISLLVSITTITALFVFLSFRNRRVPLRRLLPYAFYILLFSLANAWSEEVIFRLGVIVPGFGKLGADILMLISAVVFGAAHYRGMPNGLGGVALAGVLGWLLAKSVIETEGMFWAVAIHAVQDVVIFTAFFVAALYQQSEM